LKCFLFNIYFKLVIFEGNPDSGRLDYDAL